MKLLEGKIAIVTGAARGIGEAIAIKFAEQGANVAFTYISDSSAKKAAALAPCSANFIAMASPMPRAAPVTIATFPSSIFIV